MATATHNKAVTETKVVEVKPETFTLELSPREAQVLNCLLAHTQDVDPKFPEPDSIYRALRGAGAPDYWDQIHLVITGSEGWNSGSVRLAEGPPAHRLDSLT